MSGSFDHSHHNTARRYYDGYVFTLPPPCVRNVARGVALARGPAVRIGLGAAVKPLVSPSTTVEFGKRTKLEEDTAKKVESASVATAWIGPATHKTNQTQEVWVYSHDGPIRHRTCIRVALRVCHTARSTRSQVSSLRAKKKKCPL